jgi:hypothetical protein
MQVHLKYNLVLDNLQTLFPPNLKEADYLVVKMILAKHPVDHLCLLVVLTHPILAKAHCFNLSLVKKIRLRNRKTNLTLKFPKTNLKLLRIKLYLENNKHQLISKHHPIQVHLEL